MHLRFLYGKTIAGNIYNATIINRRAVNVEYAQPPAITVKNPDGAGDLVLLLLLYQFYSEILLQHTHHKMSSLLVVLMDLETPTHFLLTL